VTAGDENTLLWCCEVCRPIDELAAEFQKVTGRGLTDEERIRFWLRSRKLRAANYGKISWAGPCFCSLHPRLGQSPVAIRLLCWI